MPTHLCVITLSLTNVQYIYRQRRIDRADTNDEAANEYVIKKMYLH